MRSCKEKKPDNSRDVSRQMCAIVRAHSMLYLIPVAVRPWRAFIDPRAERGCVARHVIFGWLEKSDPTGKSGELIYIYKGWISRHLRRLSDFHNTFPDAPDNRQTLIEMIYRLWCMSLYMAVKQRMGVAGNMGYG